MNRYEIAGIGIVLAATTAFVWLAVLTMPYVGAML